MDSDECHDDDVLLLETDEEADAVWRRLGISPPPEPEDRQAAGVPTAPTGPPTTRPTTTSRPTRQEATTISRRERTVAEPSTDRTGSSEPTAPAPPTPERTSRPRAPAVGTRIQRSRDLAERKLLPLAGLPLPPSTERPFRRRRISPVLWATTATTKTTTPAPTAAPTAAAATTAATTTTATTTTPRSPSGRPLPRVVLIETLLDRITLKTPPPGPTTSRRGAREPAPPPAAARATKVPCGSVHGPSSSSSSSSSRSSSSSSSSSSLATAREAPPARTPPPPSPPRFDDTRRRERSRSPLRRPSALPPPAERPGCVWVQIPGGPCVSVPIPATQRQRAFRVKVGGDRWVLHFDHGGHLEQHRRESTGAGGG